MPVSELKRAGGRAASLSSRPPAVEYGRTPTEGGLGGVGPEKLFTTDAPPDHGLAGVYKLGMQKREQMAIGRGFE